jgi:hypothetical protein
MKFRRHRPQPTPPAPAVEPDVLKAVVQGPDGIRLAVGVYGELGARITSGGVVDIDLTALTRQDVARLALAAGATRQDVEQQLEHHLGTTLPFTCPRCTRTSHHPLDRRYGYCGACHDYTGAPS